MSDPMISTGTTRVHACQCGSPVTQDECRGAFAGAIHWHTPNHDAPCGLPCLQGGIRSSAYRSGEWHRDASRCPRCLPGSDPHYRTPAEIAEAEATAARLEAEMMERLAGAWDDEIDEVSP